MSKLHARIVVGLHPNGKRIPHERKSLRRVRIVAWVVRGRCLLFALPLPRVYAVAAAPGMTLPHVPRTLIIVVRVVVAAASHFCWWLRCNRPCRRHPDNHRALLKDHIDIWILQTMISGIRLILRHVVFRARKSPAFCRRKHRQGTPPLKGGHSNPKDQRIHMVRTYIENLLRLRCIPY